MFVIGVLGGVAAKAMEKLKHRAVSRKRRTEPKKATVLARAHATYAVRPPTRPKLRMRVTRPADATSRSTRFSHDTARAEKCAQLRGVLNASNTAVLVVRYCTNTLK